NDWATHECAATLLSTGSVEHSAAAHLTVEPQQIPRGWVLLAAACPRVSARPAFSLLEHAPPAQS
ncbi:MAG: hypothetical protein ABI992_10625, partial [Chthoniobacterales bacterium]